MFLQHLKRIPIVCDVLDTSYEDHRESFKEIFVTLFISTMPIWFGAFILMLTTKSGNASGFSGALNELVSNGELFLYASSLLAPVIYIAIKERDEGRVFPAKITHILIVILTIVLTTGVFTVQRTSSIINRELLLTTSLWIYLLAVVILYFAIVFNNNLLPNPAGRMKQDEKEYVDALKQRRR